MPPPDGFGGFGSAGQRTFYETLTDAINDIIDHGYDTPERIAYWIDQIRRAATRSMMSPERFRQVLNETMRSIYRAKVDRGGILTQHPGIERFTLEKVRPQLRAELDRRIMASAELIKLNREQAIETTLRRFSGWATSIPVGGTEVADRRETKDEIRKSLASLPFAERRVAVDQGHKLVANLNNILAVDGGAIALVWRSHWREAGYDFRPKHKARDGHVYMIRGNWAQERGLAKVGPDGYYDEITAVAEEPFCRCYATYLHSLRRLPTDMLTQKGAAELERVRLAA